MKVRKDVSKVTDKKGRPTWRARIRWTRADGTTGAKTAYGKSKRHANTLADQLAGKVQADGVKTIEAERLTFNDLADEFKERKLVEPVYVGDMRIAGQQAYQRQINFLKPLKEYFGAARVQAITYEDLLSYRKVRFELKTVRGGQRSIAGVNRELTLLRTMFNYARRCGYVARSPFEMGKGLISAAGEVRRDRILTAEEEARLLAACVDHRAHLRPILIIAIDTAMRKGEIFKLRWADVNFTRGTIRIRSTTTKTRKGREVGMTGRIRGALEGVWIQRRDPKPQDPIFSGVKDCKKAFAGACRDATRDGQRAPILDLRFHDLRHTATTRMVQMGLPAALVMEITGHTQFSTFRRYVNVDSGAASQAAALLDQFNEKEKEQPAEIIH